MKEIIGKLKNGLIRIRGSKISIVVSISFALFTDMVCYGVILPIIPLVMKSQYHQSDSVIGLLFAMFSLGCLIGTPVIGIVSDRIGRRIPFLVGMAMLGLSTMLFAYGHHLAVLFIARLVQGFSSAAAWVVGLALIADIYSNEQFGTVSGAVIGGNTIGALIGPIIGGLTYEHFGYLVPFYISAIFAVVDLLIRVLLVDDSAIANHKLLKDMKQKERLNLIKMAQANDNNTMLEIDINHNHNNDYQQKQTTLIINSTDINTTNNQEDQERIDISSNEFVTFQNDKDHDIPQIKKQQDVDGNQNAAILDQPQSSIPSDDEEQEEEENGATIDKENNQKTMVVVDERLFFKTVLVRLDVWVILTGIILFAIGLASLEPLLPLMIDHKFKKSSSFAALVFAAFTVPFLVLSPGAGYLTDNNKVGRVKMSTIGVLIAIACFPLVNKVPHLYQLYLVVIGIGSGLAIFFNPLIPILTYIIDPSGIGNNNGKILSLFCIFYSVGICIGPIYSTVLTQHISFFSFTISFSILLFIYAIIFIGYFWKRPTSSAEHLKVMGIQLKPLNSSTKKQQKQQSNIESTRLTSSSNFE